MKSKKFISAMVIASVIMGTSIPAFAAESIKVSQTAVAKEKQTQISKDDAKKLAKDKFKEYFNYELDESKFQSSVQLEQYYSTDSEAWIIYWNFNDQVSSIDLQAVIDSSTGNIISMRKNEYNYGDNKASIPSVTHDEANVKAKEFLNKIAPDKLEQIEEKKDLVSTYLGYPSTQYSFNYQRIINGITFEGNSINVQVDGLTGNIIGFNINWNENVKVSSIDGVISKEKAEEVIRKEAELELNYITSRSKYDYFANEAKTKLVYAVGPAASILVDAKTGDKIDASKLYYDKVTVKNLTDEEKEALFKKAIISPSSTKEINRDEIEIIMKAKLMDIFKEDYEIQGISYRENSEEINSEVKKYWYGSFNSKKEKSSISGSITIDATTGRIASLYKYNDDMKMETEEFTPKLSWEEAYNKALDTIVKFYPERIKDIDFEQTYAEYNNKLINEKMSVRRQYYFNFRRIVNGAVYNENYVSVSFNAKTGELQQLGSNWSDKISFVGTEGSISSEEAENILFEKYTPELVYALMPKLSAEGKTESETKLVYRLKSEESLAVSNYLDAFSSKFLNYDGTEIIQNPKKFLEQIKGSKYEKELSILAYQGIIDTSDYDMNRAITKMDLIKMLVEAKGYRPYMLKSAESLKFNNIASTDVNYKYLQMAVQYGILENKAEDIVLTENVTREEMAETLVKLLGYENLAKATDVFTLPVSDSDKVDKDHIGYIAIAKALGILDVEDNNIRPNDNATSVELALGVYKVLGNLRNSGY